MTDHEKWASWMLGVVVLTIVACIALVAWRGNGPWTMQAFALLSLTAIPWRRRRQFLKGARLDERERAISDKALLAAFRAVWVALASVPLVTGCLRGWDGTLSLPVWTLSEGVFWAALLVLTVQSVTTLVLYRR